MKQKITTEQRRKWGMQGYMKRQQQIRERKEHSEKIERDYFSWQAAVANGDERDNAVDEIPGRNGQPR